MADICNYSFDAQGVMSKVGSQRKFNRVIYGGHERDQQDYGRFFTFAGDVPIFMGAVSDCLKNNWCYQAKRGVLQSGILLTPGVTFGGARDAYGRWFHEAQDVVSRWHHGYMEYELSHVASYFPEKEISLQVYPLQKHDGYLVHYNIIADSEIVFCAVLGGMTDYIGRFDPLESKVRELTLADCQDAAAAISGNYATITHTTSGDRICCGCNFDAQILTDTAEAALEATPTLAAVPHTGLPQVVKFIKHLAPGQRMEGDLVVLYNSDEATLQYYLAADRRSEIVADIRKKHANIKMQTPDLRLNATVIDQQIALDAAYHTPSFFHGAIGYHAPFLGWRGWYGGTLAGWFERIRSAARANLATQIKPCGEEKVWYDGADRPDLDHEGTQYHHLLDSYGKLTAMLYKEDIYNMQEVFVDMLLHYFNCSCDLELAEEVFDALSEILDWEERIMDPDNDGLYQNFLNTWISDGHVYNGGGCTQASCYNFAANTLMVQLGRKLKLDTTVFEKRAEKIRNAVNSILWQEDKGVFAEYIDTIGNKLLHPEPELSTIYLASESNLATPEQMLRSLEYTEKHIRSVMTMNRQGRLAYSSAWLPKKYSTCGIFTAENAALALAYFKSYRKDAALQLLDGLLDAFALSQSPGGISHVLTAKGLGDGGDWDFTDVSSPYLRLIVEGLWGIRFYRLNDVIEIAPQLPDKWQQASLELCNIKLEYQKNSDGTTLEITTALPDTKRIVFAGDVKVTTSDNTVKIGKDLYDEIPLTVVLWSGCGTLKISVSEAGILPQIPQLVTGIPEAPVYPAVPEKLDFVDLSKLFNAELTRIFNQKFLSPRPQGYSIGARINGRYAWEWNHFGHNAVVIDDTPLRNAPGGVFTLPGGKWSFPTPAAGCNAVCVSMWDNFPTAITIPLAGKAKELVLFMFGSTNAMQSFVTNARLTVDYENNGHEQCDLTAQVNFDDFMVTAVQQQFERFYWANGNHGLIVRIPLNPSFELKKVSIEAIANEIIAGLLAAASARA